MGRNLITPPSRRVLANPLGSFMLLGTVGGYGLTFVLLRSSLGATASVFAVIPVLVAGWWFGWRAGLLTGMFMLAGNLLLLGLALDLALTEWAQAGWLFASVTLLPLGALCGYLRDLRRKTKNLDQELQLSVETNAVIDQKARIINSSLNIEVVYEKFAREMKKLVNFDRASINIFDLETGTQTLRYLIGPARVDNPVGAVQSLQDTQNQTVLETGHTMRREDATADVRYPSDLKHAKNEMRAAITVPLISKGKIIGAMGLRSKKIGAFGPREQAILERLANQIAPAVESAELYQKLQASTREMTVVDEVGRIISSTLDIDQVYRKFAIELNKLLDFDRVAINVIDHEAGTFSIKYWHDMQNGRHHHHEPFPLDGTQTQHVMVTGRSLVQSNLSYDGQFQADQRDLNNGLHSSLTAPLTYKGRVIATLNLRSCRVDAYGSRERTILERLAGQMAPAVLNVQLYEETSQAKEQATKSLNDLNRSEAALRHSEARFRALVENTNDVLWEVDTEGIFTYCSPNVASILGYQPAEVVGKTRLDFSPLPESEKTIELFGAILSRQEPFALLEYQVVHKDGSVGVMECSGMPVFDEHGRFTGYRGVDRDITKRKEEERRFLETSRLASIGELAAGVAHEINNPLTGVLGFSQLLLEEDLPPHIHSDLEKIHHGAQHAANIVQNLLSLSRKHEPVLGPVDLAIVLTKALEMGGYDLGVKKIRVIWDPPSDLPPLLADEHQLIQVFLNILSNAEKAMSAPDGGGTLYIRTTRIQDRIRISFQDDGPGIPDEYLSKIFEPFFTTKAVGKGVGLGLSICSRIVHEHGGKLWAESAPGQGATFYVELPVAVAIGSENMLTAPEPERADAPMKHLMIVDDEPDIRDSLARLLAREGYTIDLGVDGQDAWQMLQNRDYDCVITDLEMPGMNGRQLYQKIKEVNGELAKKVIFISGYSNSEETLDFIGDQGNPLLSKPLSLEELCRTILRTVEIDSHPV